jgi:predicted permease
LTSLVQDLRFSFRMMAKNPSFALIAILTLALGIGANSTIFSWINSTLLNPIPGATHTNELASVMKGDEDNFSYLDYKDLRDANQSFSALAAQKMIAMDLTGAGRPQRIWGMLTSVNYFGVLGVRPLLGRGFLPSEDLKPGGAPVAVISFRLWQTRFGAASSAIGQTLDINQHPYTIVGVTAAAFQGSNTGLQSDIWIPLMMEQQVVAGSSRLDSRSEGWLELLGRLRRGQTLPDAQEEMNLLMQRIVQQFPDSHRGDNKLTAYPLRSAPFGANSRLAKLLPPLMAIAGIVLLLACANVANLLLVRSIGRRREIAIRLSLGASRWRLVRQLLAESLVLALAGGGIAVLITIWTAGTFSDFIPPSNLPIALNMRVDHTVLFVTLAVSILASLFFGILPALRSSSMAPVEVLKDETGSASAGIHRATLSSALVVAQISLSLFLLVSAGLFIRSIRNSQRFNPGFNSDRVLLASFDLFPAGYTTANGIEFDRQLLAKLETLPGVQSVTLSNWVPLGFTFDMTTVSPEGYVPQLHESMDAGEARIAPNYFRTMEIPLVSGRDFTARDAQRSQPVVIVDQALADRYWPNQEAVGKRIHVFGDWKTVVGVARNINASRRLQDLPQPFVYIPLLQEYSHAEIIHAKISGDPLAFAAAVENTVHELNADLPIYDVTTLATHMKLTSIGYRVAGTFVGAFGLLALILAAVGIYGVISYSTRQRTREIGIRIALGAQQSDVFQLVLGKGIRMTLLGLAIGFVLSLALTRFLHTLLFGVTTTDALTYASVALLLCVVALTACYIPARRATRVDPMIALRYE